MSKFVYVCGINEKEIYYSEERGEFYSVDSGFFGKETAEDFEVASDFFTPEQLENLESVRVTDERELESFKYTYNLIKKYDKKHSSKIYKIIDSIKDDLSIPAVRKDIFKYFATSCVFTIIVILVYFQTEQLRENLRNKYEEKIDRYREEHQNDETHMTAFLQAIEENNTITEELKDILRNDFSILVESDIYIPDTLVLYKFKTKAICSRLASADFTNCDEGNYTEVLAYILFNEKDIVATSLALELDEYANGRVPSTQSILFGSLYTKDKTSLLNDIFNNGTNQFALDMAEIYDVDKKDIKELLNVLKRYTEASTEEEKNIELESFYAKLAKILSSYYRDKTNLNEIDQFILASQVYNGKFQVSNNLFSDILTINYDDSKYGPYALYYDCQTGNDVSQTIYFDKLVKLIKEKGNNLDYNDKDVRFLLYLTILACEDELYYYVDEVTSCVTPEELAQKIYDRVFSLEDGFTNIKPQFLYAYFSNGNICYNDILKEVNSPNDDAFSLALFVEYNKCMRKDIEAGNLSEEEYKSRLEILFGWGNKDKVEAYGLLFKALEADTSLFSELKLNPFIFDYANDGVKKYIYVPED